MERGIVVGAEIVEFVVKHIERNPFAVKSLIERADVLSFEEKRKITIPFIKKIIEDL